MTGIDDSLLARARRLLVPGERRLLGVTGAPAAGKSTVASALVAALHPDAVLVPMDGFHLAQRELERLGRTERKGAPDTFDSAGFVALMRRLGAAAESVVYAPEFRREIEEPIAGAIPVPREVPLVVVEGNYLLLDELPWRELAPLLAETWYLDPDESTRISRLVARHMAFGRDEAEAIGRALGSDQRNAELILATRTKATVIV
ncbi:MAG TPA: nucleoside/nucleotide kinase family protein [Jatrophihabitantaceae bacterium]|nr:nucleoside/nucleotide kinase family protein [Jatrophihabitantaceae bacterium]